MNFIIIGTGTIALDFINNINIEKDNIVAIWDNNKSKYGNVIKIQDSEIKVTPPIPYEHNKFIYDKIIIANSYFEDIYTQLITLGYDKKIIENQFFLYKRELLKNNECKLDCLNYIKENPLVMYNYKFNDKYKLNNIDVYYDNSKKMYYVMYNNKKIYISRKYDNEHKVQVLFNLLLKEADKNCPHCYENFLPKQDEYDILIDLGGAEGIFSLRNVEKANRIIIVEYDENWVEALNYTFEQYNNVTIIQKYANSFDDVDNATLNSIYELVKDLCPRKILVKMDIEGYEEKVLSKMDELLKVEYLKVICACYHHFTAESNIIKLLEDMGLRTKKSIGKMFFSEENEKNTLKFDEHYKNNILTKFRTALICGEKLL